MSEIRIVTRRARAAGCMLEGASDRRTPDHLAVLAAILNKWQCVHVYAHINDIGDPRWRLWLTGSVLPLVAGPQSIKIEFVP